MCDTSVDQFGPDTYCKCYAVIGEDPSMQFCAFTDSEGILTPCDALCCKGGQGCPGQYTTTEEASAPEAMAPKRTPKAVTRKPVTPFKILLLTTIFLILLSTFTLFIS